MRFQWIYSLFALTLVVVGCKTDQSETLAPAVEQQAAAREQVEIQAEVDGLSDFMTSFSLNLFTGNLRENGDSTQKLVFKCGTVSRTMADAGLTVIVDFGSGTDCNGKLLSGKMTVAIPRLSLGAGGVFTRTATYENFNLGGEKTISGSVTTSVTLVGGKPVETERMTSLVLSSSDGTTYTLNGNRTRRYDTKNTPDISDDEFSIDGKNTWVSSTGITRTSDITNPVVIRVACKEKGIWFPAKGTVLIMVTGKSPATLDYGNGGCDNEYTVAANGSTVTKTFVPKHK